MSPVQVRKHRAGPFIVTHISGNRGDRHAVEVPRPFDRVTAAYRAMLISGRMTRIEAPAGASLRSEYIPGRSQDEMPPFTHPGVYVMECAEDNTFFLCVQRRDLRKFKYEFMRGETAPFVIPQGGVFALGEGRLLAKGQTFSGRAILYAKSGPVEVQPLDACTGTLAFSGVK